MSSSPAGESPVFQASPNAVLTAQGLFVDGHRQPLRHREDFANFVFSSGSAVGTVLASLFPNAVAIPRPGGQVEGRAETAWSHYSRLVISLKVGEPDSSEFLDNGKVVLQWCVSAVAAAQMLDHNILKEADFLPVLYLARHGGQALACSATDWDRYCSWMRAQDVQSLLADDPSPDPRPVGISVTAPWPGALGAAMGSDSDAAVFENATDILSDGTSYWLSAKPHAILAPLRTALNDLFDEMAKLDYSPHAQVCMTIVHGSAKYGMRATRDSFPSGRRFYCFRLMSNEVPSLANLT